MPKKYHLKYQKLALKCIKAIIKLTPGYSKLGPIIRLKKLFGTNLTFILVLETQNGSN